MLMLFAFVLFMGLLYHTTRQLQALNRETYRPKCVPYMMLDRGGPLSRKKRKEKSGGAYFITHTPQRI